MYIAKHFYGQTAKKTAICLHVKGLETDFCLQKFVKGRKVCFLVDTLTGRKNFQGGYPPLEKRFYDPPSLKISMIY